jgi:ribosomal protein S20
MIDRLAKRRQFHDNKAANLKGKLTKFVAGL